MEIYEQMLAEEFNANRKKSSINTEIYDFRTITSCVSANVNLMQKEMNGGSGSGPDFEALDQELLGEQSE